MNKVGILYHPKVKATYKKAEELQESLRSKGVSVWLCSAWEPDEARTQLDNTDLILTVGGDGTILRAAQALGSEGTPITGINLGKLGFMTELSVDEAADKLPLLLAGEGWTDERSLLEAELLPAEGAPKPLTFYALNDVVLAHGGVARIIRVEASVDGEPLTTYKADGVILSTATGSTGYALAAGGPILHPQAGEILLLPLVPHLSASYSLVLPPESTVKLGLRTAHSATLTVDGHIAEPLTSGAVITVKRSTNTVRFLRIHAETSFYGSLEKRLKGKQ